MSMSPFIAGRHLREQQQRSNVVANHLPMSPLSAPATAASKWAAAHTSQTSRSAARSRPWRPTVFPSRHIARVTGVDPKTLRKHYREELDLGEAKANAQVAGFLFSAAKNGNVTAQIFWLKTRAKWRETPVELKHSGSIGGKDLSELSDEELMKMACTLGAELGFAPIKTIDANAETLLSASRMTALPKGRFAAEDA